MRTSAKNGEAGTTTARPTDWSRFDVESVLRGLRTANEAGQRRLLRKLHLRWWHAGATTMQRMLRAAGVPAKVLELVRETLATCALCRTWTRPGPDTVASGRIIVGCNVEAEGDVLFITLAGTRYTVLHLVDRGVRWRVTQVVDNRATPEISGAIDACWARTLVPCKY